MPPGVVEKVFAGITRNILLTKNIVSMISDTHEYAAMNAQEAWRRSQCHSPGSLRPGLSSNPPSARKLIG